MPRGKMVVGREMLRGNFDQGDLKESAGSGGRCYGARGKKWIRWIGQRGWKSPAAWNGKGNLYLWTASCREPSVGGNGLYVRSCVFRTQVGEDVRSHVGEPSDEVGIRKSLGACIGMPVVAR